MVSTTYPSHLLLRRDNTLPFPTILYICSINIDQLKYSREAKIALNKNLLELKAFAFISSADSAPQGFYPVLWESSTPTATGALVRNISHIHRSLVGKPGYYVFGVLKVTTRTAAPFETKWETTAIFQFQELLSPYLATKPELNPFFLQYLASKEHLLDSTIGLPTSFLGVLLDKVETLTGSPELTTSGMTTEAIYNRSGGSVQTIQGMHDTDGDDSCDPEAWWAGVHRGYSKDCSATLTASFELESGESTMDFIEKAVVAE